MIPIGRGQRELIVGDRQTGKTSIGIDTIKASSILSVFLTLGQRDCMTYTSVLMAAASASPLQQFLSAYTGSAVAEFFMYPTYLVSLCTMICLSMQ